MSIFFGFVFILDIEIDINEVKIMFFVFSKLVFSLIKEYDILGKDLEYFCFFCIMFRSYCEGFFLIE